MRRFRTVALAILLCWACMGALGCLDEDQRLTVTSVVNCGSKALSAGVFDLDVTDHYKLTATLVNNVGSTAYPAKYRVESGYVFLRRAKVYFEYPPNFSLAGAGAVQLHTEPSPLEVVASGTLKPGKSVVQSTTTGGETGTTDTGSTSGASKSSIFLIPPALANFLSTAVELSRQPGAKAVPIKRNSHFYIKAHVVFYGVTAVGGEVGSAKLIFPIEVCRGCLDKRNATASSAYCKSSGTSSTGETSSGCPGQDGVCYSESTTKP